MELKLKIQDNFDLTVLYCALNIAQSMCRHNLSHNTTICTDIENIWSTESSDEFRRISMIKNQIKDVLDKKKKVD